AGHSAAGVREAEPRLGRHEQFLSRAPGRLEIARSPAMKRRMTKRTSFTLVEILIVVAIISILLAIAAGVYFRTARVAQRKAAESFIVMLDSAYEKAQDKVLKDCSPNAIPPEIVQLAYCPNENNELQMKRALVLYRKLEL